MRRSFLVSLFVCAAVVATASAVPAASSPSGTIACQLDPDDVFGVRFVPWISATPEGRVIVKATLVGTCDSSGVTGGKGPIDHVEAKLLAKLEPGSVCSDVVSTPHFGQIKLSLKWKGQIGGKSRTIATSKTHLVQGSWDDGGEALVFTADVFKGAFAGSTTTTTITIDAGSVASLRATCPRISGIYYAEDGLSAITVP